MQHRCRSMRNGGWVGTCHDLPHLRPTPARLRPQGVAMRDAALEFLAFGLKQVRACIFVGLFFAAIFLMPRAGVLGTPRYDALLIYALAVQAWMVWARLETVDELKAVCLFHAVGFVLEVFKTSHAIGSWSYPDRAYTKILGVPLFSGFM